MLAYLLDGRWPAQLLKELPKHDRKLSRRQRWRQAALPFSHRTKLFAAAELLWQMRQCVHGDRDEAVRLAQLVLRRVEEDLVTTLPGAERACR